MVLARRGAHAPWPLALALLLAACGGSGGEVRSCAIDADCGAGAYCIQASCVANRPPAVTLQLPAAPTTNRVLRLEATATDPDPGDSIIRHTWSVIAVSAGCDSEMEPSSGARLELIFWCAGSYEVTVVAEDARSGVSAPATQTIEVAPATGLPVVVPAPASAVDHLCAGAPLTCRPAQAGAAVALPLTATVDDPAGGTLTYRWRPVPPPGADARARVTWSHGDTSLSTDAWVETPGGSVAGNWRFRLRVTTAAGLLAEADQVVQVGNRPPELPVPPLRLEHRYADGIYLAQGALPLPVSDPDGDPVGLTLALEETGAASCTSKLGAITAGAASLEVRCTDAAGLLGTAARGVRVRADDGNGGSAEVVVPVEIANRPPVVRLTSNPAGGSIALDHSVGPCVGSAGSCFVVAGTSTFEAVDPDGDPISGLAATAAVLPGLTTSAGEATTAAGVVSFRFTTPLAVPGEFRATNGSTGFTLLATAADPFGGFGRLEVPVVALNRPPVVLRPVLNAVVPHRYDPVRRAYTATASLAAFEDPDGDPLVSVGSAGDAACYNFSSSGGVVSVECVRAYAPAPGLPPLASFTGDHRVVARASDGWASVTSGTTVSIQDGPPSATVYNGAVESCFCNCPKWNADGSACVGQPRWIVDRAQVPLPVVVSEADGDPVQVTYSGATPIGGAQKTVLSGSCSAMLANPVLPITVQVTIDDGVAQARTSSTVTGVTCATVGLPCAL